MLQAFSGMISTMGEAGGKLARASFSPVDLGTGMHAFSGILAALLERQKTGRGMFLEVSLLDTAMGFMSYLAQNYWCSGKLPRNGNRPSRHGAVPGIRGIGRPRHDRRWQ
jgi:formyl-CoA transferase